MTARFEESFLNSLSDNLYQVSYSCRGSGMRESAGISYFKVDRSGLTNSNALGWVQRGGTWYYYASRGVMTTNNWVQSGGAWYWLKSDGAMAANEWITWNGKSYYLRSSGAMAADEWIGPYYVDANGAWDETKALSASQTAGYAGDEPLFPYTIDDTGTSHIIAAYGDSRGG